MKKTEENFVPFRINANLCNIIQMVLFLKDSQQSIHFKYFNTVKKKTKTWKTIIRYIKHQYIANKGFTLCVLLHVPQMHICWITDSRHPLLLGGGSGGKFSLPLFNWVLPSPTPQLYWKEKLKQHCPWHTKQLGFQVVFAHSRKGTASPRPSANWRFPASIGGLSPCIFLFTVSLHNHSIPGQRLWVLTSRNISLQIHIQGGRVERHYKEFIAVFVSSLHTNKTTLKSGSLSAKNKFSQVQIMWVSMEIGEFCLLVWELRSDERAWC